MRLYRILCTIVIIAALALLPVSAAAGYRTERPLTLYQFSATVLGPVTAPTAATAALVAMAGNVTSGTHSYKVCYVTAAGTTLPGATSNVVTTVEADHGQVTVTIPTSAHPSVTARTIYRTVAGDMGDWLLVGTVGDNTTTTYTDNTADGALGAAAPATATATVADTTLAVPHAYPALCTTIINAGSVAVYFNITGAAVNTSTDLYVAASSTLVVPPVPWKTMKLRAANESAAVRVQIGY